MTTECASYALRMFARSIVSIALSCSSLPLVAQQTMASSDSDRCKQEIRQFGHDMAIVVSCDFHIDAPDGLPQISPTCFSGVQAKERNAIAREGRHSAYYEARQQGHGLDAWCDAAFITGNFRTGSPMVARAVKQEPDMPASVPCADYPGALKPAICTAAKNSATCVAADRYNQQLARLKQQHPEIDASSSQFNTAKAKKFACLEVWLGQRSAPDEDGRDVLDRAEQLTYPKK